MRIEIVKSTDNLAAITTSYGGFDKAFRVRPGPVSFQIKGLTGATSLEIALQFAALNSGTSPDATVDADWYSLVDSAGAILNPPGTTAVSFVAANGNCMADLASRLTPTTSAVAWDGCIPHHAGWVRIRVKRTGSAVTALTLSMLVDADPITVVGV